MIEERKRASGAVGRALIDINFYFLGTPPRPMKRVFRLVRTAGNAPPGALASWPVGSPWTGRQRIYLTPA